MENCVMVDIDIILVSWTYLLMNVSLRANHQPGNTCWDFAGKPTTDFVLASGV
jgi:hypothetical protein